MFKTISIIGFGLIGSSIARKVKIISPDTKIICYDHNTDVCRTVIDLNLADVVSSDPSVVEASDLVILAVPVGAIQKVVQSIVPFLTHKTILTDVGSVKEDVVHQIEMILPEHINFIAGHPIAGTEFSGPEAGFAELFENRLWILTPSGTTHATTIQYVQEFCEELGANVKIMAPDIHDRTLSMTSHLPQLISYMMIHTADRLGQDLHQDVISCSANGFHGFARIAASDPTMWRDVYLANKDYVLESIDRFQNTLLQMRHMVQSGDGQAMHEFFSASRARHLQHLESKKL